MANANDVSTDVAIIGGGPAGIGAALELRRRGVTKVMLLDRESAAGGTPRHCGHPSFGWPEFGRILRGPVYARRLAEAARAAGVELRVRHSVVAMGRAGQLRVATPDGEVELHAKRVIIATGARETPLAARLISGDRAVGCVTTGTLQSCFYLYGTVPFRRPVILGTEIVTLSALLTCRSAKLQPAAVIETNTHPTIRWPWHSLPRIMGIPMYVGADILEVRGSGRVQSVTVQLPDGSVKTIACDGVLCTGRFVPEIGIFTNSDLTIDPGSGGPAIDQFGRCSDPSYFAAGNVLRPVETAAWSYKEGRRIGGFVADDLAGRLPKEMRTARIERGNNVKLVVPQQLALPSGNTGLGYLQLRFDAAAAGDLTVVADGKDVWKRRIRALPERRVLVKLSDLNISSETELIKIGMRG